MFKLQVELEVIDPIHFGRNLRRGPAIDGNAVGEVGVLQLYSVTSISCNRSLVRRAVEQRVRHVEKPSALGRAKQAIQRPRQAVEEQTQDVVELVEKAPLKLFPVQR